MKGWKRKVKITEIKKDLKRKLSKTIDEVADESEQIMDEELKGFYSGGKPSVYKRTGTLGTAPQITDKYCTGNSAGVTASLNQNISYDTGTFSGAQVIDAAEHGEAGIVGRGGFWERSDTRIEDAVNDAIVRNF